MGTTPPPPPSTPSSEHCTPNYAVIHFSQEQDSPCRSLHCGKVLLVMLFLFLYFILMNTFVHFPGGTLTLYLATKEKILPFIRPVYNERCTYGTHHSSSSTILLIFYGYVQCTLYITCVKNIDNLRQKKDFAPQILSNLQVFWATAWALLWVFSGNISNQSTWNDLASQRCFLELQLVWICLTG